jgi:predicted signal transduction protein with EAL and GGDEF domain
VLGSGGIEESRLHNHRSPGGIVRRIDVAVRIVEEILIDVQNLIKILFLKYFGIGGIITRIKMKNVYTNKLDYSLIDKIRILNYLILTALAAGIGQSAAVAVTAGGCLYAALWLILTRFGIISTHKHPRLKFISNSADLFFITILIYYTGNVHSLFIIGYYYMILVSSQDHRINTGFFSAVMSIVLFGGMGVLIILGFLPGDLPYGGVSREDPEARTILISLFLNSVTFLVIHKLSQNHRKQTEILIENLNESREELNQQNSLIELLLHDFENQSGDWLWELDEDDRISYSSEKVHQFFSGASFLHTPVKEFIRAFQKQDDDEAAEMGDKLIEAVEKGMPFKNLELKIAPHNGVRWVSYSGVPLKDGESHRGWRGVGRDITAQKELEIQLHRQANFHHFTGLPNRFHFSGIINGKLEDGGEGYTGMLGIIRLGGLDKIRTNIGNRKNNEVMSQIIRKLTDGVGDDALIAIMDGWDLGIWIDNPDIHLVNRLHQFAKDLKNPLWMDPDYFHISCSVGLAFYPEDAADRKGLFKAADLALNSAGSLLNHRVVRYSRTFGTRIQQRLNIMKEMPQALGDHQFEMYYQPQIRRRTKEIIGAEALIRWKKDGSLYVSPVDFIPLSEQSGFIITLGEWILERITHDAMTWPQPLQVAVNISGVQLEDPGRLLRSLKNALKKSGLPPERLVVEITESAVVEKYNAVSGFLKNIKNWGVRIALDDFGTGYSSLSYLQNLPLDKLKIDQSFIRNLHSDQKSEEIVHIIILLARTLSLTTVAEGIDKPEQVDILGKLGCDVFQGFLYGKPLAIEDFISLIPGPSPVKPSVAE